MPNAHPIDWIVFHSLLLALLGIEVLLLRNTTPQTVHKRSYAATAVWIIGSIAIGAYVYLRLHPQLGQEFLAGYALEESLSIDNLFVFLLLFKSFRIQPDKQRGVLFYGILGAVIMRAGFIFAGVQLLNHFEWLTYLFAVVLLIAAVRLVLPEDHEHPNGRSGCKSASPSPSRRTASLPSKTAAASQPCLSSHSPASPSPTSSSPSTPSPPCSPSRATPTSRIPRTFWP
jgi:TerC family integral membrane protein